MNWFNPRKNELNTFPILRREVDGFFKVLDQNHDGKLSFEEFLGEETHIDKIFRTMDKDNDGYVTKEVHICYIIYDIRQARYM